MVNESYILDGRRPLHSLQLLLVFHPTIILWKSLFNISREKRRYYNDVVLLVLWGKRSGPDFSKITMHGNTKLSKGESERITKLIEEAYWSLTGWSCVVLSKQVIDILDWTRFHSFQMQFFEPMERYLQVCFSGTMVVEENINSSSNFSFNNCILLTLTERRVFVFINTIRRIVSMVSTTVGFLASAVGSSSTVVLLPFSGQRFYCCLFRMIRKGRQRILTPTWCCVWIPLVPYQLGVYSSEVFLTWAGIRSFIPSWYVSGVIGARARVCVCTSSGQITTCHFRMVQLLL